MAFETDESVLFIEVSSIQRCPDRERERFHYNIIIVIIIQVTEQGYGVSYIMQGDYHIYFHVSSFKSAENTVSYGQCPE